MSTNKQIVVDSNVLLEILANREKAIFCIDILEKYSKLYLSPTSIHVLYYFGKKYGFHRGTISIFLSDYKVLDFGNKDYLKALEICKDEDFEDALQIAASLNLKNSVFFSLDKKMVKNYKDIVEFVY